MSKPSPRPQKIADDIDGGLDNGVPLRTGTLLRGLAILDILIPASHPLSLAEIAADASLDLSTTFRLLRTLEDARYVIRIGDGKRYVASPKALRPLPLLHPLEQLRRDVDPIIRELAAKVSKTVVLVAYLGTERVVVEIMQSAGSLNPYYSTWLQGPLHASAPGKALLISMETDRRRALLGPEPYAVFTPSTITTWDALEKNLEQTSRDGVVMVHDEYYKGLSAMATNFYGWKGRAMGCIAVTGHSTDFGVETRDTLAAELVGCAKLMPLQAVSLKLLEQLSGRY